MGTIARGPNQSLFAKLASFSAAINFQTTNDAEPFRITMTANVDFGSSESAGDSGLLLFDHRWPQDK